VGSAVNFAISGLPGKPVVNATILAALSFLDAVPVCSFCLLLVLHAEFKSHKMLSVHTKKKIGESYRVRIGESQVVISEEVPPGV
jgi:hypothetical protein